MKKQLLISFVSVALLAGVTGCTSGASKDDSEAAAANDEAFAEEGEGDFADEGGDGLEEESGGEAVAEQSGGEENLDGELGAADSKEAVADNANAPQDELAIDEGDELSLDEGSEALPEEVMQDPAKEAPPQVAESETLAPAEAPPGDDSFLNEGQSATVAENALSPEPAPESAPPPEPEGEIESTQVSEAPIADEASDFAESPAPVSSFTAGSAGFIPVQKIRDSAFSRAGANLNRVYIARPGDDLASVSQKLFGSNKTRDLVKWNPNLSRGLKTGDKVYYQSASDPADSRMLTFYEEAGVPAATHVTAEGENIRSLSKELLGSSDSWKEVWATNMSVESKGDLPSGVELRYWPEGSAPVSAPLAQSTQPSDALPPSDSAPSSVAENSSPPADFPMDPPADMSPPPMGDPSQVASNDPFATQESAPPVDSSTAGSIEPPPPPPPPLDGPPPPPVARKAPLDDEVGAGEDTTMMMGAGIILILSSVALLFFIRKNRAKRIDLGQTQV